MSTVTLNPIHSFIHSLTHSLSVLSAARGSENRPRRLRDSFKQEHIKHDVRVNTRAGGGDCGRPRANRNCAAIRQPIKRQPATDVFAFNLSSSCSAPPPARPDHGRPAGWSPRHTQSSP